MARKKKGSSWKNSGQIESEFGYSYFDHYRWYLEALAVQLFEWKGLPDTVSPMYLERTLHRYGYIGVYDDPMKGLIVSEGAIGGGLNHYNEPTEFQTSAVRYNKRFPLFNYTSKPKKGQGVVIYNNVHHRPTFPSLRMFARDLAETRQVTKTNINAQKTPFIFMTDDESKLSMQNLYNQIEGNAIAIFANKGLDLDNIKHFPTVAPFVADKLNAHRGNIWNETMTFMGLNNANLEKRERVITSEADSNNEQIKASGNIWLSQRQLDCQRVNLLYGTNWSVDFRVGAIEEMKAWIKNDMGGVAPWQGLQSN